MKPQTIDKISEVIEENATPLVISGVRDLTLKYALGLLGGVVVNPFVGKIISYVIELVFDRWVVPAILLGERKGLLKIDRKRGAIILNNMNQAEVSGNETEFNSAFDSI